MKKLNKFIVGMLVSFVSVTGVHAAETVDCSDPSAVAQVGESCYAKLSEAFTEATDKQTVILKKDVNVSTDESPNYININKAIELTFDLNGHAITSSDESFAPIYVQTGKKFTITDTSDAKTGKITHSGSENPTTALKITKGEVILTGGTISTERKASKNVGSVEVGNEPSLTNEEYRATLIVETGATITGTGISVLGKGTKVTINGGTITSEAFAISGNGSTTGSNATVESIIEINGGTLESTEDVAIYHPQSGTLTINGGDIIGKIGIVARGGQVSVSQNAHIVANGDPTKPIFVGSVKDVELPNGVGIVVDNTEGYQDGKVKATVTGGDFETKGAAVAVYKVDELAEETKPTDLIEVKGGTFNQDVEKEYLTTNVEQSENGVVGTLHEITTPETTENGTIEVPANAAEGEEVTITVIANEGFKVNKVYVNGKEITPNEDGTYTFIMDTEDVEVTAEFTKIETSGDVPATTPDDEKTDEDKTEEETPNTLDKAPIYLTIGAVALTSVTALGYMVKKKLED